MCNVTYVYSKRKYRKCKGSGEVRDGFVKVPFMTVANVAHLKEDGSIVFGTGIAVCSDKDMPCKKTGKDKAIGRAMGALSICEKRVDSGNMCVVGKSGGRLKFTHDINGGLTLNDNKDKDLLDCLNGRGLVDFRNRPHCVDRCRVENVSFVTQAYGGDWIPDDIREYLTRRLKKEPVGVV